MKSVNDLHCFFTIARLTFLWSLNECHQLKFRKVGLNPLTIN